MEVKERIIDLRQYFVYLWENILIIILVAALTGGALVGYAYKKAKSESSSESTASSKTKIDTSKEATLADLIQQNYDAAHQSEGEGLQSTFSEQPYGSYIVVKYVYITFDYNMFGDLNITDIDTVNSRLQGDVSALFKSDAAVQTVIDNLDLTQYPDMKDIDVEDLKGLTSSYFSAMNMYRISVIDVDEDRADSIANELIDVLQENAMYSPSIKYVEYVDSLDTVYALTSSEVDSDGFKKGGIAVEKREETSNDTSCSSVDKKHLLKFGIVGVAGGVVMAMGVLLLLFIFCDTVRTALDADFAGFKLIGNISSKASKKDEDYKRLAADIAAEEGISSVLIVPVDPRSEKEDISEKLTEEIKSLGKKCKVSQSKNILEFSDAKIEASSADRIVVLATYGKTRMKDLIFAGRQLSKKQEAILGMITK